MLSLSFSKRQFILTVAVICALYFAFELFFNSYAILAVDEFWFAHLTYQYKDSVPYRDFAPYKTVLGYYFLLAPLLFTHGAIHSLIITKNVYAILNSVIFFSASIWLSRFFSKASVIIGLFLIISSDIVLTYSTNIRVDLFAYWFCLFSWLCLLSAIKNTTASSVRYTILAGCLIGLGFCTSQKAIWYLFASNCALLTYWAALSQKLADLKRLVVYNVAALLVIAAYITIFAAFSSMHIVLNNIFEQAAAMYQLTWYDHMRGYFWHHSLTLNPFLFFLWPVTWLSLAITFPNDDYKLRAFIVVYASVILFCLIPYQQVFPYYMQVTIPAFLMLYTAFFCWLLNILRPSTKVIPLVPGLLVLLFVLAYIVTLFIIIMKLIVTKESIFIGFIPIAIMILAYCGRYVFNWLQQQSFIWLACLFTVIVYPCASRVLYFNAMDGKYQKNNVLLAEQIVSSGGDYLAGMDLLSDKTQPIPGLRNLMGPAISYLYQPDPRLRRVMLPSLDENPDVHLADVLNSLKQSSIKIYVNNYRLNALPKEITQYLQREYQHYAGSIYIYSPTIREDEEKFELKFSGQYQINAAPYPVIIDGKEYENETKVFLSKGTHQSDTEYDYRLTFMPELADKTTDLNQDIWAKMAF